MDLTKILEQLRGEKEKLERAIASLEQLQGATWVSVATGQRRGRVDERRRATKDIGEHEEILGREAQTMTERSSERGAYRSK
jgi:hypothetical protein